MTESEQLIEAMDGRVKRRNERRDMFKMVLGTAAVGGAFAYASAAAAQTTSTTQQDIDVLNFALNLEYLEANFYSYAAFGTPIAASMATGSGTNGYAASATSSAGARAVVFRDPLVAQYAKEIAQDEINHVTFLRSALNSIASNTAVAQPQLDVGTSPTGAFSNAARAAGIITGAASVFDPYASDENFLLGAFIFEDVGVTAYKGASPLITNKTYLEAAAGILAVEAYHASIVRTVLYAKGMGSATTAAQPALITNAGKISDARDSLDGTSATRPAVANPDDDQGLVVTNTTGTIDTSVSNIVPLDSNGLAYSRTTGQVLNVVYLNAQSVTAGGFFPAGLNGNIKTSTNETATS